MEELKSLKIAKDAAARRDARVRWEKNSKNLENLNPNRSTRRSSVDRPRGRRIQSLRAFRRARIVELIG